MRIINLHKNSGGPMIPRNKGIKEAKGKYIIFLDNDDYLGEEALERLFIQAEKSIRSYFREICGHKWPRSSSISV